MGRRKSRLIFIPLGILAILVIICIVSANYMIDSALVNKEKGLDKSVFSRYEGLEQWYDSLREQSVLRDTFLLGRDGYRLHAFYARKDSSLHTVILVHGYKDSSFNMMMLARMYREELGFNILVPDLHGHGLSEGDDIRMGWLDRLDIRDWILMARSIFDTDIVLHGISMGAATVMMTVGDADEIGEYVTGAIEDCGYSSVWDEFSGEIVNQYGLPPFPLLDIASVIADIRLGWNFREASSVRQVALSRIPMLFIHGDDDDYVPTRMLEDVYGAKVAGYKEKYYAKGSAHAMSYYDYPGEYTQRVRDFLNNHVFVMNDN